MKIALQKLIQEQSRSIVEASNGRIILSDAEDLLHKAFIGGEIEVPEKKGVIDWVENRLIPNCAYIDEAGYAKMCVDALKILHSTAGTDYGSTRQRDMGQLWADMTRGYLGELAMKQLLESRWGIRIDLGHEVGALSDYLPLDIHRVTKSGETPRPPKLKVSIKTTKAIGIWLDIPGSQFSHSDIHLFVKVCAGRDHLFSFFKSISVFKDKVLKKGVESGSLSETESSDLFSRLPDFRPIPAYVCGFAKKDGCYESLSYKGNKGRKHYEIKKWSGPYDPKDIATIKDKESVQGQVRFTGINEFSNQPRYLFNAGSLFWEEKEWREMTNML